MNILINICKNHIIMQSWLRTWMFLKFEKLLVSIFILSNMIFSVRKCNPPCQIGTIIWSYLNIIYTFLLTYLQCIVPCVWPFITKSTNTASFLCIEMFRICGGRSYMYDILSQAHVYWPVDEFAFFIFFFLFNNGIDRDVCYFFPLYIYMLKIHLVVLYWSTCKLEFLVI